jgi:SAM-dependent methyltransferase
MRSEEFQQLHGRMGLLTPGVDAMEIAKSRQPMFHETAYIVAAEEIASGPETLSSVLVVLRKISLDDFGRFFLTLPNPKYPKLSKLLPAMAPSLLQQQWNGSDGETLLIQTTAFVRSVAWHYAELTGKQLGDARILDFGCGWGRVIRMMYYFAAPDQIYGCDANSEAIRICREARIPGNFEFSDYIPSRVPFMGPFDLIYASSLFMHLSKRVTASMLSCLRNYIANDGLLVVTIRPVEFWEALNLDVEEVKNLSALHRNDGFAFLPHNREQAIDGEIAFGDTSMTCGYLEQTFPQWKPVCIDRSLSDPLQLYLFLQPAG